MNIVTIFYKRLRHYFRTNSKPLENLIFKLLCFLLIINMGCSGAPKPDPLLEEAFAIHKQSLQTAKEAREILKNLTVKDSIRLIMESRLEEWNDNIIEVPGFEHEHDHDHGHDHHHHHGHNNSQMELAPEVMLAVQKELLDSVKVIKDAFLQFKQANEQ